MPDITVSVQAEPTDLPSWLALAQRLESSGFHALVMGDHPGSGASPWPALGCAAAVTGTLKLGTYVMQAGVRQPMHVAADAANLDVLAPGRALLGIGAGHTPREWPDIGQERPAPAHGWTTCPPGTASRSWWAAGTRRSSAPGPSTPMWSAWPAWAARCPTGTATRCGGHPPTWTGCCGWCMTRRSEPDGPRS